MKTVKFIRVLCIILALVTALSSTALAESAAFSSNDNTVTTYDSVAPKYMNKLKLTSNVKNAKKALVAGLKKMSTSIDLTKYKIPRSSVDYFYMGTVYENPELFWAETTYYYWYDGGYITKIQPNYHFQKYELSTRKKEYNKRLNEYLSSVQVGMSDYDKALVLHDKLVSENTYNEDATRKFCSYGALYDCGSVCQGYAIAYAHLLQKVGIESHIAYSAGMNHVWNIVKIGGKWYHVDSTWDDAMMNNEKTGKKIDVTGRVLHKYFLVNTSRIKSADYGHYGWITFFGNYSCSSNKYHNSFDKEIESKIIKIDSTYYYVSKDYRFTAKTNKKTEIYEDANAYTVDRVHDCIYFNSEKSLYYYNINTKKVNVKCNFRVTPDETYVKGISIIADRIYYLEKNYGEDYCTLYYLSDVSFRREQVVSLTKVYNVKTGIKLTWKKAKYATKYEIYRKTSGGKYKLIKTVGKDKLSYIDKTVKNKVKYYYYIKTAPQRVTSFSKGIRRVKK